MFRNVIFAFVGALLASFSAFAVNGSVSVSSRYPWSGKVDIKFQLSDVTSPGYKEFYLYRETNGQTFMLGSVTLDGEPIGGKKVYLQNGTYNFVWDSKADLEPNTTLNDTKFYVCYMDYHSRNYCVINLDTSEVSYLDQAPTVWSFEHKTKYLVMRKIPKGEFIMGRQATDCPGFAAEGLHKVTLTKDFWIGIFEVTGGQFVRIMSDATVLNSDLPVGNLRFIDIVGKEFGWNWPTSTDIKPDFTSFFGCLNRNSKLQAFQFNLPTEAQWEYACRAGTTTALNNGLNLTSELICPNLELLANYYKGGSGSKAQSVGMLSPNNWGLYDMHGNLAEWCLDAYSNSLGNEDQVDPIGPPAINTRVVRGGSYDVYAQGCTSSTRRYCYVRNDDDGKYYDVGFRVAATSSYSMVGTSPSDPRFASRAVNLKVPGDVISADADEVIYWSNEWSGDDSTTVRVSINDKIVVSYQRGSGIYRWMSAFAGNYLLKHETIKDGEVINTQTASFLRSGMTVRKSYNGCSAIIDYWISENASDASIWIDGNEMLCNVVGGSWTWSPLTIGTHTVEWRSGDATESRTLDFSSIKDYAYPEPNPGRDPDPNIVIDKTRCVLDESSSSIVIIPISGIGSWQASTSESWIQLINKTGSAGRSLIFKCDTLPGNSRFRDGFVYVNGHAITVIQVKVNETIEVGKYGARALYVGGRVTGIYDDWLTVELRDYIDVARWFELGDRTSYVRVLDDKVYRIHQTGVSIKVDKSRIEVDYQEQEFPINVKTIEGQTFDVSVDSPWLSVVGNVSEVSGSAELIFTTTKNTSFISRTGHISIGDCTIAVIQEGMRYEDLMFEISSTNETVNIDGAELGLTIDATDGLPWTVTSDVDWIVIPDEFKSGVGSAEITYTVTQYPDNGLRKGKIIVSPPSSEGIIPKECCITQEGFPLQLVHGGETLTYGETIIINEGAKGFFQGDISLYAYGDTHLRCESTVSWFRFWESEILVDGNPNQKTSAYIYITLDPNLSTEPREGKFTIAGYEFIIHQYAAKFTVPNDIIVDASASDGFQFFEATASVDDIPWTATTTNSWIYILGTQDIDSYGRSETDPEYPTERVNGMGNVTFYYMWDAYSGNGEDRVGTIEFDKYSFKIIQKAPETLRLMSVKGSKNTIFSGNDDIGYVVAPSADLENVEFEVADGLDTSKVILQVNPKVRSVSPKGAQVMVMNGDDDITNFLTLPPADKDGRIDLSQAQVKEELVKESLDFNKGAKFKMEDGEIVLTTTATKPGLVYTLREGTSLDSMKDGDSKVGDGLPWSPKISVKGDKSAFYSIKVTK